MSNPFGGTPNDPFNTKSNAFKSHEASAYDLAHEQADTDTDRSAIHHTLGLGPMQAAPGNHTHKVAGKRIVTWQGLGPWSAAAQPSPTTGGAVTIDVAGNYNINMQASGFSSVVGVTNWELWVDGFNLQGAPFFYNQINTHATGPRLSRDNFPLTKGTHYAFIRFFGSGAASDNNDWAIVQFSLSEET